ncbi:MAG: hypothetical protein VW907_02715 [Opitutae bacterium]
MADPITLLDRIALDSKAIFGQVADGGVEATITPSGGSALYVRGTFRDGSEEVDPSGVSIIDGGPIFTCSASDVSTVLAGSTCAIDSVTYYVIKKDLSGYGSATLTLSEDTI